MAATIKLPEPGLTLYRRLLEGVLDLHDGDVTYHVVEGDFVNAAALPQISAPDRRRLGPVLRPHVVAKLVGAVPEEGQIVFRALSSAPPSVDNCLGLVVIGEPRQSLPVPYLSIPPTPPREGWRAWARTGGVAAVYVAGPNTPLAIEPLPDAAVELEPGVIYRDLPAFAAVPVRVLDDDEPVLTEMDEETGVVVLDPNIPWHSEMLWLYAALLPAHAAGDVEVVYPVHNIGGEPTLPMSGDKGSAYQRLAGGLSPLDVATALALSSRGAVEGAPRAPCAAFITPLGVRRLRSGGRLTRSVVALDAYAWQPVEPLKDEPNCVSRLLGYGSLPASLPLAYEWVAGFPRVTGWPEIHRRLHAIVSRTKHTGIPVALYSHAIGPWGGVAVLVELADRLREYGMSSFLLYHAQTEHDFRPWVSMRKSANIQSLLDRPREELGFDDGVLIASHWSSGSVVQALRDRYVTTTIVQDREDWFAGIKGTEKQLPPEKYAGYLALGRGGAVAQWIIDSLVVDHGIDPSGYEVIPSGIDCTLFRPPTAPRPDGPVRILAMWRPQTSKRRGLARLRALYDSLHRRFGSGVSLELFGWKENAPPYAVLHGRLPSAGVAALMRQVDIVVEPSEYQGFGLPGLEAMACGAALVSTACRGPAEYIVHEHNALMVPHDDLEDAVVRLIEDADLRRRLQKVAPATVRCFGYDVMAAKWARYVVRLWRLERGTRGVECDRADEQAARLIETVGST